MEAHEQRDPWEFEVERDLPAGDGPTERELRADYLLETLAGLEAELAHLDDFTARRIQMVQDHRDAEAARIQRRIDYLGERVRGCVPYDADTFAREYGKKSIRLPHGTIGYRAARESVDIADGAKAVAWAKAHGVETRVVETVNKTPLLDYVKATGDVPDPDVCGFELVPGSDDFFVKAGA